MFRNRRAVLCGRKHRLRGLQIGDEHVEIAAVQRAEDGLHLLRAAADADDHAVLLMNNKQAWPGGILSVSMDVADGKITEIAFHGDFLSTRPMTELVAALRGTPYRAEEVGAVLDRMPLAELFGAITRDEVLATMFYF